MNNENEINRKIWYLALTFPEGVTGNLNIIRMEHSSWDGAICIQHRNGITIYTGLEHIFNQEEHRFGETIFHFMVIPLFKDITNIDFLTLLEKEANDNFSKLDTYLGDL